MNDDELWCNYRVKGNVDFEAGYLIICACGLFPLSNHRHLAYKL